MAQERLQPAELQKVEDLDAALKDLREKQGDKKEYTPEFYAYLKKTNPAVFKLVMDMDLSNPEAPDAALKLAVAQSLLSVWLDTKAPVEKAYKVKERKEKTFTIGDDYPIKVEQLSNGKWKMNGDIKLIYGSKEDAERDGAMIQRALDSLKSKKIEPEHYDDPFYSGLIDGTSMFIHEVGDDDNSGIARDARTLAKSAIGLVPSMEQLANLANTLLKNSGETGKETSERLKTKTEIEEVKLGSAPALNVTLVDKLVNELVMSGAPKFDYEIVSDNEVEIRSHGAENITILKDGENWVVEGSDNKLKYSSINSAVKDAVLMQEMEAIAMTKNLVIPDGEKGPYYLNSPISDEISVHTDGLTDPDVNRSWANMAMTDVKTADLVNFMNDRYAEKASVVQETEAKITDDGELLERRELVQTLAALKVNNPELGDPEKMVVNKDNVEVTSTYSDEPIRLIKMDDGNWNMHIGEIPMNYANVVNAVEDALLVQKIEYDAEKLKDKITKGKESAPFVVSTPGDVGLDTEGLDTRWYRNSINRSTILSDATNPDFVANLNERWEYKHYPVAPEVTPPAESLPDGSELIDNKFSVERGENGRMKITNSMEEYWEFDNQKLKDLNGGVMPNRIAAPANPESGKSGDMIYDYDATRGDYYCSIGDYKLVINQDRPNIWIIDGLTDTSGDKYELLSESPKVEATAEGKALMAKYGISIKLDPTNSSGAMIDFGFTTNNNVSNGGPFKVKADGEKLIIIDVGDNSQLNGVHFENGVDDTSFDEPVTYEGYSKEEILQSMLKVELQDSFDFKKKIEGEIKYTETENERSMEFKYRGQDVLVTTKDWWKVNIGGVDCNITDEFTIDFFIDEIEKETRGASGSTSTDVPTTTNTSPEDDDEVAPAPTVEAAHGDGEPVDTATGSGSVETETKVIEKQGAGTFTVDLGDEEMTKKIQDVVKDAEKTPVATSDRAGYEGKTFYYDKEKGSYYTADGERLKIYNGDKVTLSEDKRSEAEKEVAKDTAAAKAKATEATKVENKPEVAQVVDRITSKENADLLVRLNDYKVKGYKEPAMKISRDDVMSQIDKALIGHELSNADTAKLLAFKGEISGSDKVEDSKRAEKMSLAWTKSYAEALQYAKASGLKVDLNVVSKGMHENNKVLKVTVGEGAKAKTGEIKVVIPILGKVEAYDKANHVRITYKGKENDDVLAAVKVAIADLSKS